MSDDYERPFIEDGSQFGISQATFAQREPAEQRELMIQWFFQNFEDPANETPWDGETKEYMFIWGGPYSASDQMWEKFGDVVPESLIADVVDEIESDGTDDWAPRSNSPFYDDGRDDEDQEAPEPPSLEIYLDEPSDRYGSPEEREARAEALEAIGNLRRTLQTRRPIGIGHNQPPNDLAAEVISELPLALQELCAELRKSNPEITLVKRWATPLRNAVIANAKWTFKKLDGALTAVVNTAAVGGVVWLYTHPEHLQMAYDAIIKWLDLAAKTLF